MAVEHTIVLSVKNHLLTNNHLFDNILFVKEIIVEQNSDCNPSWSVDTITTFEKNMLKLENIDLKRINSNGEKVKKLLVFVNMP